MVLAAAATAIASAGLGLLAQALGGSVERLWTGTGPTGTAARRAVDRASAREVAGGRGRLRAGGRASRRAGPPLDPGTVRELARLAAVRNRISLVEPAHPCWTGDRVRALDLRVHQAYRLDLDSAWSRLWLVLPADTRTELRTARRPTTPPSASPRGACRTCWSPSGGGRPP
ncbi:hypothetical protein O1M63_48915 [Streptomyces mirabilis]|nr:hypothetical protein [Streptomyces mirabilis]